MTLLKFLVARVKPLLPLKIVGCTLFIVIFFQFYFFILAHPAGIPAELPLTWFDKVLPFQPMLLLPYASLWLYASLPAVFAQNFRELIAFGAGMAFACTLGLLVFWLWPTVLPPQINWGQVPGFEVLGKLDKMGNVFPSLHVASAVLAALFLHHMPWPKASWPRAARIRLINILWCILIVYSTMAVKQHVLVDVVSGVALAVFSFALIRLWQKKVEPIKTIEEI